MGVTRKTLAKLLVTVFVANLVVMGAGAAYSYQHQPPIPNELVAPDGETVVTHEQVQDGKAVFQSNALMNHGSILGNGASSPRTTTDAAAARRRQISVTRLSTSTACASSGRSATTR
jgi:nitric oxide reductase large subunit